MEEGNVKRREGEKEVLTPWEQSLLFSFCFHSYHDALNLIILRISICCPWNWKE